MGQFLPVAPRTRLANYVRSKVEETKSGEGQTIIKEVSAADEIKKFKELLDMGVITQNSKDI